jgi:adenylate cyclase class 2
MYEVELKVRGDHDRVRERLDEVGATALGTVTQEDTYFDAPDREFARTDEALRVRRERRPDGDRRVFLTYKGPLVDDQSKTREEAETRVDDETAIRAVLDGLGYEAAATVRKERARYAIDDCIVTLDTVDGLGEFVEVEVESNGAIETPGDPAEAIPALREAAVAVMDRLGLDPDEQIRTSYLGLLLAETD